MKNIFTSLLAVSIFSASSFAINCKRTISVISPTEMKVQITVSKKDVNGIARLLESIPEGAEVKYTKAEGGSSDIAGNKIKFIWMSLPAAENITVAYIIKTTKLHEGDYSLTGKFSYLEGGNAREFNLEPSAFTLSASRGITLSNPAPVTPGLESANEEHASAGEPAKRKIVYGVQVAATQKKLPENYFSNTYQVNDNVKVESANGKFKYILGEFGNADAAAIYRESLIKKGITDSFIVAFLDNKPISVNEARKLEVAEKYHKPD